MMLKYCNKNLHTKYCNKKILIPRFTKPAKIDIHTNTKTKLTMTPDISLGNSRQQFMQFIYKINILIAVSNIGRK